MLQSTVKAGLSRPVRFSYTEEELKIKANYYNSCPLAADKAEPKSSLHASHPDRFSCKATRNNKTATWDYWFKVQEVTKQEEGYLSGRHTTVSSKISGRIDFVVFFEEFQPVNERVLQRWRYLLFIAALGVFSAYWIGPWLLVDSAPLASPSFCSTSCHAASKQTHTYNTELTEMHLTGISFTM